MRTFLGLSASAMLFLTVASLMVIGGVIFALLLFFPLFALALVCILITLDDQTVRQHNPSMDAAKWRTASQTTGHEGVSIARSRERPARTVGSGIAQRYAAEPTTRQRKIA